MKTKKYDTLYQTIKHGILSGEYTAGSKLPSKRMMADKSGCSLITVEKAYSLLADEGYLTAKERKGYFVSDVGMSSRTVKNPEQDSIRYLPEPKDTDDRDFEFSLWCKTVRKVLSDAGNRLFRKAPSKGCEVLRNAIAGYLHRYRGMLAQPEQIIIGSGAEQLYESVVRILGREKIYGIEDPSYEQIRRVYTDMGARVCPLTMEEDGIACAALKENHFDILHVTPFHNYPTGITTSIAKRYEYLKWAEKSGNYIVEDDFDSEFFLPGHPIKTLYELDTAQSVIYLNTFSKSLSPSMRIGYIVLPEPLLPLYDRKLDVFSCSVPVMDQYFLAEFIANGSFERHLNRMRRRMKK